AGHDDSSAPCGHDVSCPMTPDAAVSVVAQGCRERPPIPVTIPTTDVTDTDVTNTLECRLRAFFIRSHSSFDGPHSSEEAPMRLMRRLVTLPGLLAVVALPLQAATPAPAGPLDGSTWSVKVTPDDAAAKKGEKEFDDVIVFRGGKVTMSECVKAGFAASSY